MDSNNNSRTVQTPVPVQVGEPAAPLTGVNVKAGDWRRQIHAEQRQKIIKKIIETLKQLLPSSGQDGTPIQELEGIAIRFEEKIYAAANSQSDYLRKISSKMLSMEKSQTPVVNSLHYNSASIGKNPTDPATNGLQSQVNKQEQPLSIPMTNQSHEQQQLLYQNNMRSNGGPNFTSRQSAMPPVRGFTQAAVPNVAGENPSLQNIQNVSTVAQNSVENSMGPGMPSNTFGNSQRQMQTRQQRAFPQPQQQQSQNPQEYLSKQQLQHQLIQPKYQQGSMQKPAMQSDIEQQQQQKQQPSVMQSAPLSNLQQNQQSSVQQSTQSMLQQYPQPVRQQQQQQPQQVPIIPQQQASISQLAMMATQKQQQQQQQQMIRQQPHRAMQQNQLSQPNIIADMKQLKNVEEKRVIGQQNNMSDLRQQQLIDQHGRLPNRHQQQVVSTQFGTSGMASNQQSIHVLQQSKIPIQPQMQQTSTTLQQQLVSQIQTQPAQTQQLVGLQQQTNPLQMDMHQSLQISSMSGQPQNLVEQQKQLLQSQQRFPEMSSTSFDSMAQTGSVNGGDWQEEVYQKIKTMKEMYFARLAELYQRICAKLKQNDSGPQQLNNAQLEHMKLYKVTVERYLQFLRLNKNQIQLVDRERVGIHEQKIVRLLSSRETRNTVSSLQRGSLPQPNMHAMQHKQQPESQNSQMHSHENQVNPQMQSVNVQAPGIEVPQNSWTNMQHNSMSSASNISNSHQDIINTPQPTSNLDVIQSDTQNSLQHVAVPSLEPNLVSGSQQINTRPSALQSQMNTVQSNLDTLQPKSNLVQHQHLKQQEGQISRTQQLKQQLFQGQRHQQFLHKQQQQPGQLPAEQMSQLHQMTDPSDLKQHHSAGQLTSFYHQKLKSGTPFPVSTTQGLPAASPEVSQHSSPQIDQPSLLKSLMQSSSSPFIVPSPSTPLAPSPIPVDSEKVNSGVASLLHAGIIGHQQTTVVSAPSQSLAIDTPGISAAPLVADFTSVDGTQGVTSTIISDQPSALEQPHERLMRLVNRSSARALSAAVSDISSVVSTVDRIAGSAPGNGSRAGIGEDLAAVTNSRLHVGNSHTHHRLSGTRKMKRYTTGVQSNVVSSAGSVTDFFCYSNGSQASDVESTATSPIKRLRVEANNALVKEIQEINQRLIDTVVDISDQESDSNAVAAALEGCEGTIVKCSFNPVALSPNLKLLFSSAQLSPIQPLRLLVPNNYPICSPIFLDKFPVEISKEYEDFSMKAMARLKSSLRNLSHPMSLGEIVRTWDVCARAVISGYAQQNGGGSFSSRYGTWERCLNPG